MTQKNDEQSLWMQVSHRLASPDRIDCRLCQQNLELEEWQQQPISQLADKK